MHTSVTPSVPEIYTDCYIWNKLNTPNCTFTTRDSIISGIKNITELSCVLLTLTGENPINPIHQTYDMFRGEEEGGKSTDV
jgi:hypothetical protein